MANVGPENRPLEKRQGLDKTVRFQLDVSDGTLVVFKKPKKERGPLMDRSIELFNRDRYITRKLGYFCNTVKTEGKGEYSVEKAMDSDCFDFYDELNRSNNAI